MGTTTKHLNELVAEYRKADRLHTAAAKKARDRKKELDALEAKLRESIVDSELESLRIGGLVFTPSTRDIAEIHDAPAFFRWCFKHDATDLLHRRIAMEAARERWDAGIKIDGVRPGTVPTLSVTKGRAIKGAK